MRQIIESHGGQVALHSTPGHGSTFVHWLPLPNADSPPPPDSPI